MLVAKETLDQLRSELKSLRDFKDSHSNCTAILTKQGAGDCEEDDFCPESSSSKGDGCHCKANDESYNKSLNAIVQQEPPSVEVRKPDESTDEFPISMVLADSKLWQRYHHKASVLLAELYKSSSFKVDKLSMVFIDDVPLHCSIFQLMKVTFHPIRKNLHLYNSYIQLLEKLHLEKYVSNKYLMVKDIASVLPQYWFYIGH